MADFVFVGPSLAPDEAGRLLPGCTPLPPIRHGDLLRLDPRPGDRVLIIDGLFMQTPPVRHREILAVLERGVTVAGSSSMGALRAAELWRYGMRGFGQVFQLFRDGVVTGDDEVAVVYGPAADGYPVLSEPLVDTRIALRAAAAAGALTTAEADALLELARSLPFRIRGRRALERAARAALAGDVVDRYLEWLDAHPTDAKAQDARLLLTAAAATPDRLPPPNAGDRPIENVETYHFERWRARHSGEYVGDRWVADADTVAVLMALHPDFPALHRRHVLRELVGEVPAAEVPAAEVNVRAVELARRRGLLGDANELHASPWLVPAEHGLPPQEAAVRILVRALGTRACDTRSERVLPPELLVPDVVAIARRFTGAALRLTDRLSRPDPYQPRRSRYFRASVIDEVFGQRWGCAGDDLVTAVWDRGFPDLVRFRAIAEPFVGLLKFSDEPRFPVLSAPATTSDWVTASAISQMSTGPAGVDTEFGDW